MQGPERRDEEPGHPNRWHWRLRNRTPGRQSTARFRRLRVWAPTILVYGYYDVQPPEPLELWDSPPFEPTIRNGRIYGGGTSDNKAQLFTYLKTVETLRAVYGELPVSLKLLYEGEEEIGSPSLAPFAEANKDRLKADVTFFSDSHIHESGRPLLILGLKGLLYCELVARGVGTDQHSMRATSLPSAAWRPVSALATLRDVQNRIVIPGFYDAVRPLSDRERDTIAKIPCDAAQLKRYFGVSEFLQGRASKDFYYNLVAEPTCNISGISAGYDGPGIKIVLPAEARAKLDIRLVPDQRPDDILQKLRAYLDSNGFTDIEIVVQGQTLRPSRTPMAHAAVPIICEALAETYETDPVVFPNIGGAGPDYVFEILGQACFVIPHATHDRANHAPNENMELEGFFRGIRTQCRVFRRLGAGGAG